MSRQGHAPRPCGVSVTREISQEECRNESLVGVDRPPSQRKEVHCENQCHRKRFRAYILKPRYIFLETIPRPFGAYGFTLSTFKRGYPHLPFGPTSNLDCGAT